MRSIRRTLLDEALDAHRHLLVGDVLDVGGKRMRKRGKFRPDESASAGWRYLNIDPETEPDYLCSADSIPVEDGSFDAVLTAEVIEHLREPTATLREIHRVLRPGGQVVATIPFLHPVHGDPEDYQRWTADKLRMELDRAGLAVQEIRPMGSLPAVVFDICWVAWVLQSKALHPLVRRALQTPFVVAKPVVMLLDRLMGALAPRITTGYLVLARKGA